MTQHPSWSERIETAIAELEAEGETATADQVRDAIEQTPEE
ncbi:hypothetical protein NIES2135_26910 [Leptolyngbya boryana NIES-2135]|jgi:hypothetical protein|uniref:Uncharacterized protein n=1 Tax=Leptolyngbya boryana NIES-2135 TaxID=1973484 RepID=A0A1Z4JGI9_LEPBY|nr:MULTISPECIES: hypothetical protein [Leptolyngbya]BAY55866.1 hypothetical protein NIES2135_26910 [Leptolyngbya boryana NIES-2135]